ncbi:hypothetical protein CEXT_19481 [Caerostris extrusa]|uniref:SAP domain-containing protein n=1 Tax=Caerostris extrusa TaxID=172846 RepID=A0AAV4Y8J1_CAEEX|nr:hypothetical protein CEXT_19481 [Caerostris extrusa]
MKKNKRVHCVPSVSLSEHLGCAHNNIVGSLTPLRLRSVLGAGIPSSGTKHCLLKKVTDVVHWTAEDFGWEGCRAVGRYSRCIKTSQLSSGVSGESLWMCAAWYCPDGTQHLSYWPILAVSGQSLASNNLVIERSEFSVWP